MTYKDYVLQASITECSYDHTCEFFAPYNLSKLTHYALGLATEALELQDAQRRNLPLVEQLMELSDICWFSGLAAHELQVEPPDYKKFMDTRPSQILDLCEDFASRIKAGLYYGSPIRKTDASNIRWKEISAEIFSRSVACGFRNGHDILKINITKLRKRYGDKFTAHDALNRDTAAETKAVEVESVRGKRPDTGSVVLASDKDMELLLGHKKTVLPK